MTPSLSTPDDWPEDAVARAWVENLFDRMAGLYGRKLADLWAGTDRETIMRTWGREMARLTGPELKRGVERLVTQDWPPTLPQFVKLCRPPVDFEAAFNEAAAGMQARERGEMGKWSSPAIYWAAMKVGPFEVRTQSYGTLSARWKSALEAIIGGGAYQPIPEPAKSLPAPGKTVLSRENAERMLRDLKATGIFRTDDAGRDPKRWAKKILQRVADGDATVTHIQKQFATEALKGGI